MIQAPGFPHAFYHFLNLTWAIEHLLKNVLSTQSRKSVVGATTIDITTLGITALSIKADDNYPHHRYNQHHYIH